MSLQPSQLSSRDDTDNCKWQELFKLAEILSTQHNLKFQLEYISSLIERSVSGSTRIWLADPFLELINHEEQHDIAFLVSDPSKLMQQALQTKKITSRPEENTSVGDRPDSIVIPLSIKDEPIGAIQIDKSDQGGFSSQDIEFSTIIAIQFSLALSQLKQEVQSEKFQTKINQILSTEEISKSICSDLDRGSLINNAISLLYQKFGFSRVSILTAWGADNKTLKKISISDQGIETEKIYYVDQDTGPISWVIQSLASIIIDDAANDSRFPKSAFANDIRSALVIPLLYGDVLVGVMELCSDTSHAFDKDNAKTFENLAEKIGIAIRNADQYNLEQMGRIIFERLHESVGTISANTSLDEVMQDLLSELEKILPLDASSIWLFDNQTNESGINQFISSLHLAAVRIREHRSDDNGRANHNVTSNFFDQYFQNPEASDLLLSKHPWISKIINSETPIIRSPDSEYEPIGGIFGYEKDYSAIGAPLIIKEQPIGILVLVNHLPDQYNIESRALANKFVEFASIAIENSRLYSAAHDQAWVSTALLQVAEATQSIATLDELLDTVVNMLPTLIGVNACAMFLWDQSLETFFPKASFGFEPEQSDRLNAWEIEAGCVAAFDQLLDNKKPVILNTEVLPEEITKQIFINYDLTNDLLILFPITSDRNINGAILIDFTNSALDRNSPQEIWDEIYSLVQGVAHQTAISIENLQLIKSQEEEAYISIALLQVAQAIVSLNKLDEILASIVRITPILVGVKRCIIYLWEEKEKVFRQSQSFGFSKNDLIILGQVIKSDEFTFIEKIQQSNHIIYHPLGLISSPTTWNEIAAIESTIVEGSSSDSNEEISIRLDNKSLSSRQRLLIGFPLSIKSEILGVMLIEEEEPVKGSPSLHIREKRIEIVQGITQQAAIAIKNELLQQEAVKSERMERELQLAREIQSTFLPEKLQQLPGWDIDARWQPARQVAGDFYDILILDEDRVGIVIADVADKGMPAALFMTLIRTLIRAAAKEKSSPAAVLSQVNELLIPDAKHGMFVTVFYAVFSLHTGRFIYANAGHNPPVVKQQNRNDFIELTRTSIALGLFEDIEVYERELTINPGDWVLLYTDGITEAFSIDEELFGTQRLYDLLTNHPFTSSSGLLDSIESSVNQFIKGTELSDDITLAAIYRKIP